MGIWFRRVAQRATSNISDATVREAKERNRCVRPLILVSSGHASPSSHCNSGPSPVLGMLYFQPSELRGSRQNDAYRKGVPSCWGSMSFGAGCDLPETAFMALDTFGARKCLATNISNIVRVAHR